MPSTQAAIDEYRRSGGQLTDPSCADPIVDDSKRAIRDTSFNSRFPSFENLFYSVVNFDSLTFKNALIYLIDITYRIVHS